MRSYLGGPSAFRKVTAGMENPPSIPNLAQQLQDYHNTADQ